MNINEFSGTLYKQQDNVVTPFDIPGATGQEFITGEQILDTRDLITDSIIVDIAVLVGFAILFRLLAFVLLKYSLRQRT